ncbi:hypothetical protein BOX24_11325 [Leptospirillum ferriphilum]|uniref:Uncharacterized protein n=1 Tax=Leptospirillum ferriphilum TaxID=178606 RepID=A0A1V3SSH6_9BACT|nr:MAG: hypothetical protein UBAL2_80620324 [Leptospirillum rubarum]OOH70083.1 hypothetical protein BOX24_11325 [Leptospirillum ferriphilum]
MGKRVPEKTDETGRTKGQGREKNGENAREGSACKTKRKGAFSGRPPIDQGRSRKKDNLVRLFWEDVIP